MARIKLPTKGRYFIPAVSFHDEERNIIHNRDEKDEDQIKCQLTLASVGQRSSYLGSYSVGNTKTSKSGDVKTYTEFKYDLAVKKHVSEIIGLEEYDITDGKSLVAFEATPELNDIIQECFFKICGIHEDDTKDDSDAGEFSQGE